MRARMLIVVIYHNYIILLWGGERGNKKLVRRASGLLSLVPVGTEGNTVWAAPVLVRALWTSSVILAGPVRHLSPAQRLPFRPGQMRVLWYLAVSLLSKMRSLSTWECHLWLEATIWPKAPEFEPLSARLHWNFPWIILTSMSLSVLFNWVLQQWFPPPCWIWGVVSSLGQNHSWPRRLILGLQTILADAAHVLAQGPHYRLVKAVEPK